MADDPGHMDLLGLRRVLEKILADKEAEPEFVRDPSNHDRPLWVVYGPLDSPSILCCKLIPYSKEHRQLPVGSRGDVVCIWGLSNYQGRWGFRTLGIDVYEWMKRSEEPPFWCSTFKSAMQYVELLIGPQLAEKAGGRCAERPIG